MSEFNKKLNNTDELKVGTYEKKRWTAVFNRVPLDDIHIQSIDDEKQTAMIRIGDYGEFYEVKKQAACDYINDRCYKCHKSEIC